MLQFSRRSPRVWALIFTAVMVFGWATIPPEPDLDGCRAADLTAVPDTLALPAAAQPVPEEKLVCLTFDDGPSKNTPRVLEILAAEGVPATFFVIAAENNQSRLPLIAEEAAAGHQIALHSASHDYSQIYQSTEAFWQDIDLLKERISPYVDTASLTTLRFPGGSTNTVSRKYGGKSLMQTLKLQAEEKGYRWVDWNVCAGDAAGGHPSASQLVRNVQDEAAGKTNCIVLMHDTAVTGNTVEALPEIIRWFRESGYTFCTIDQLYARRNG